MEDKLQLPVGTPIQVQQEGIEDAPRFNVKLLGYYPAKGLIVTNTEFNGKTVLLTDDTKLVARAVQGNIATGVREVTNWPLIVNLYEDPYEMMPFLSAF